jgi:hypothetical protein
LIPVASLQDKEKAFPILFGASLFVFSHKGIGWGCEWISESLIKEPEVHAHIKLEFLRDTYWRVWFHAWHTDDRIPEDVGGLTLLSSKPTVWTAAEVCSVLRDMVQSLDCADDFFQFIADKAPGVAGLDVLQAQYEDNRLHPREIQAAAKPKANRRKPIAAKLRFEVLHRADYTCQACGAKAADGAELHIDHIHPVSKGGTNDPTNLQALCRDCNLGKGARVL